MKTLNEFIYGSSAGPKSIVEAYKDSKRVKVLVKISFGSFNYSLQVLDEESYLPYKRRGYYICRHMFPKVDDDIYSPVSISVRVNYRLVKCTLEAISRYGCDCIVHKGQIANAFRQELTQKIFRKLESRTLEWRNFSLFW
jgi:hypothetical protein